MTAHVLYLVEDVAAIVDLMKQYDSLIGRLNYTMLHQANALVIPMESELPRILHFDQEAPML